MKNLILYLLMIGTLVGSSGCGIVTKEIYVTTRMPIIETVERPYLDEDDDPLVNIQKIMQYSLQLERAIELYNEYARELNKESGYEF